MSILISRTKSVLNCLENRDLKRRVGGCYRDSSAKKTVWKMSKGLLRSFPNIP